jgi:hypothetical protein
MLCTMPREIKLALPTLLILVILSFIQTALHAIGDAFPLGKFISETLPHLITVASVVSGGALLYWIVGASIHETFKALMDHGFVEIGSSVKSALEGGLGSINSTAQTGLTSLAAAMAHEVRSFPRSFSQLSDEKTLQFLTAFVKTPEVRKLLSEDKIAEAIAVRETYIGKDKAKHEDDTKREEDIAVLLLSAKPASWERAIEIWSKTQKREPKFLLTLSYRFWSIGKLEKAVQWAEQGLEEANARSADLVPKFKNSLAYFYAESAKPEYEKKAREYIAAARQDRPNHPSPLDTAGFVEIVYAKTREDVLKGVALCEEARKLGLRFESYAISIERAGKKIQALDEKSTL